MGYLLDTNLLLRLAQPTHAMHQDARSCIRALLRAKKTVYIVPQVIFEFWVVATRPVAKNGLGLSLGNAKRKIEKAESFFRLVQDIQPIYREWLRIVDTYAVSGLPAHDARIVATMKVHSIDRLVTFNAEDFKRYNRKEITVLMPGEVSASLAT